MSSFTHPIAAQRARDKVKRSMAGFWTWRRARGLPWFVPCTPEIRRDMVRGWVVGRLLNHVRSVDDDPLSGQLEIWAPESGYRSFPYPLLGQPIKWPDEVLPSVLESLALTIIGESFAPHGRLKELGQSINDGYGQARRSELGQWIQHGRTEQGAPVPDPEIAGTTADSVEIRTKLVLEMLEKYQSQARENDAKRLTAETSLDVSRAWELRNDLLEAVTMIRHVVEGLQAPSRKGTW
jgi:hypothetical protein